MTHRYLKDVVSLSIDSDKCNGCGRCNEVCPHAVFEMAEGKARMSKKDLCM